MLQVHVELKLAASLGHLNLAGIINFGQTYFDDSFGILDRDAKLGAKRDIHLEIIKPESVFHLLEMRQCLQHTL